MCKELSQKVRILVCAKIKAHTDIQRNKHTFQTKQKEKQTYTEKETEVISICLVGLIHVLIHFQGET